MEELKEPVKNSELHINAQNYPEGCYEELEKLKKEYQSQYADIESKHKDFHGRDDRSAKELMDLTVAFRKRIKTIRGRFRLPKRRFDKTQIFRHSFLSNFFAENKNASKARM